MTKVTLTLRLLRIPGSRRRTPRQRTLRACRSHPILPRRPRRRTPRQQTLRACRSHPMLPRLRPIKSAKPTISPNALISQPLIARKRNTRRGKHCLWPRGYKQTRTMVITQAHPSSTEYISVQSPQAKRAKRNEGNSCMMLKTDEHHIALADLPHVTSHHNTIEALARSVHLNSIAFFFDLRHSLMVHDNKPKPKDMAHSIIIACNGRAKLQLPARPPKPSTWRSCGSRRARHLTSPSRWDVGFASSTDPSVQASW